MKMTISKLGIMKFIFCIFFLFACKVSFSQTNNAFGNNMKLVDSTLVSGNYQHIYAIYSGDINQDRRIDVSDFLQLDPSIQQGDFGYFKGDLNGDGSVDASDFLKLDPNIQLGIGAAIPQ